MDSRERKLAEAAAALSTEDFRYLRQHGMVPEPARHEPHAEKKASPAEKVSSHGTRRHVEHRWPEVGAILEADYHGAHYEAEVVLAPGYKSGRAVRILTGPAAGMLCRSPSGAMLKATEWQRQQQKLGRRGVSNGWSFWRVKDE